MSTLAQIVVLLVFVALIFAVKRTVRDRGIRLLVSAFLLLVALLFLAQERHVWDRLAAPPVEVIAQ